MVKTVELTKEQKLDIVNYILNEISISSLSLRKATTSAISFFKRDGLSPSSVLNRFDEFEMNEQYARGRFGLTIYLKK